MTAHCISRHSLLRRPKATWLAAALTCPLLLGACAGQPAVCPNPNFCQLNGDFGRPRQSLLRDGVHDWMGPTATGTVTSATWNHQLTDDERKLRDLAYPLIDPPYDRNQWLSVLGEYGITGRDFPYPDRAAYASKLFQTAYRSQTARYNKLMEDIRNDVVRLDPFFAAARYVTDIDRKREKSLAYVSNLTIEERDNTLLRIRENLAVVAWVQGSLRERVESYRVTLERLVIAAPSPNAVEAERALTVLQQHVSGYGT